MRLAVIVAYHLGAIATWLDLTFFSGFHYNWWNWIVAVTVNPFLAEVWPIYWAIILPLTRFGIDPLFGDNHLLAAFALIAILTGWFWIAGRRRTRR